MFSRGFLSEERQAVRNHDMPCVPAGTQTAALSLEPPSSKQRPADEATSDEAVSNYKKARVEDAKNEDSKPATPQARPTTPSKRTAYIDPAVLRENEDGLKRIKLSELAGIYRLDGIVNASSLSTIDGDKSNPDPVRYGTCSSCLDIQLGDDMLRLSCKDEDDTGTHAYCRHCLRCLFES
ncbi:hypothetical protein EJ02DRAFT_55753 [Clathrospora elynae]|uniref:RING-type domain-containing protein n=1 Tax=Clathrospora elynae TaxID=706981 RepID=A0A6A5SD10_9PLEO|nr:hypothetical protein EJ02DRAFT_55753 [Clathrospora elynae]